METENLATEEPATSTTAVDVKGQGHQEWKNRQHQNSKAPTKPRKSQESRKSIQYMSTTKMICRREKPKRMEATTNPRTNSWLTMTVPVARMSKTTMIALSAVQEDRPHCRRKQEMRRRAFRSSKALFLRMALTKIPIHQPDVLFGCFKPTTINIPSSDAMTSWLARLISTMLHT